MMDNTLLLRGEAGLKMALIGTQKDIHKFIDDRLSGPFLALLVVVEGACSAEELGVISIIIQEPPRDHLPQSTLLL